MNLIEAIQGVPDYRHARGIRHRLGIILTIVLLGSCTGYWGYKPLAEFTLRVRSRFKPGNPSNALLTKNHRLSLIKLLDLSPDIQFPSASTFRNIMMSIDFQILAELFNVWAENSLPINFKELFAIDGKCIKSTVTGGNKSYQNFVSIVSVYSHQQGWVVRHQAMENHEKSEISVVEELIKTLYRHQIVITADALHCQKKLLS